jgi:hydrogenase nickel incorporation protein HypA/HybF
MHEASLMAGLMRQLDEVSRREDATRIVAVSVWLGALSHLSPDHFAQHFEVAARGTIAEGARLHTTISDDLEHPDAQGLLLESVEVEA